MKDPDSLDVVVTWAGGNRSHNYFPSCLPVAMFKFEHENELHQLAGRSERTDEGKEFIVACVENENVEKEAAKVKEEEAKYEAQQEDEQIDKTVLVKRPRETRNQPAKDNAYKKQKKNE